MFTSDMIRNFLNDFKISSVVKKHPALIVLPTNSYKSPSLFINLELISGSSCLALFWPSTRNMYILSDIVGFPHLWFLIFPLRCHNVYLLSLSASIFLLHLVVVVHSSCRIGNVTVYYCCHVFNLHFWFYRWCLRKISISDIKFTCCCQIL